MKLKISDEKLDELAKKYVNKLNLTDTEDGLERTLVVNAIKRTYRLAESNHQSKVDKLTEIISKMKEALEIYSRKDNWKEESLWYGGRGGFGDEDGLTENVSKKIDKDKGKKARKALAEVEILEKGLE